LEQVHAPKQRRLSGPRRTDQAHHLVLGNREVDPAQDLQRPEGLVQALNPQRRRGGRWGDGRHRTPADARARSRATSQSTTRARGKVMRMNTRATARYGVKLKVAACLIWADRKISTTPTNDTSTVSFCNPMKSFSSGGITRRT